MSEEPSSRNSISSRWIIAVLGLTVLGYLANAVLGALNQDEGWYLYAARLMMEGEIPHRDFFFTQGVLMPAIYACLGGVWSFAGVLGGRLLTACFSLIALWIAGSAVATCTAKREERPLVRLLLFSLLGLNLWYTYFTTIPKTYGLCTLGIAIGCYLLTHFQEGSTKLDSRCVAVAGIVFAAIVDIRLSMGVLLPIIVAWLWWHRKLVGGCAWLYFSLAAGGMLLGLFLPELLFWPEDFFAAQQFHAARVSMGPVGMVGCLARVLRFNPLLVLCSILFVSFRLTQCSALKSLPAKGLMCAQLWLLCAMALAGVHWFAPVPYDDYWVPALLPFAMTLSIAFTALSSEALKVAFAKATLLIALLLTICASPVAQDWFIAGHDRFWVQQKEKPDLFVLWSAARHVRNEAERLNEDTLWTQDTYLAVEAGLRVPKGMEMGPFSDLRALDPSPRLAAWSGYTFALEFPSLTPALDREERLAELESVYGRPLLKIPAFGQGRTSLVVAERTMP